MTTFDDGRFRGETVLRAGFCFKSRTCGSLRERTEGLFIMQWIQWVKLWFDDFWRFLTMNPTFFRTVCFQGVGRFSSARYRQKWPTAGVGYAVLPASRWRGLQRIAGKRKCAPAAQRGEPSGRMSAPGDWRAGRTATRGEPRQRLAGIRAGPQLTSGFTLLLIRFWMYGRSRGPM